MVNRMTIIKLVLLLALIGFATSCILDPEPAKIPDDPDPVLFEDLKAKDDILINLDLCFDTYNPDEYNKLLDEHFVFFFSPADYNSPDDPTPEQWDRDREKSSYTNFWDPNRVEDRITSRFLQLTYQEDNWTEITPDDPVTFPDDDAWYVLRVEYDMSVDLDRDPVLTLLANDHQLEITIRWDEDKEHYRIVQWRDDVE